jgi:hypothetical protein
MGHGTLPISWTLNMDWFEENVGPDIARMLIRVRVELTQDQIVDKDVRPDVLIDYDMLEEQLQTTPASFAFWSMLLAEGKKQVAALERAVKRRRGEAVKELLDEGRKEGVKVRTADVKDLVEADEQLNRLEAKLILAHKTTSKLFAVVDAIRMKSEHLRSLAGFKRQEQRDV